MLVGIGIKFLDHHGLQVTLSDASEKALFFTFPVTGEDSCEMVPLVNIIRISWESGYKEALSQARKEYFDGVAQSMQQMAGASAGCSCGDEDEDCDCSSGPYVPSSTSVDGYS